MGLTKRQRIARERHAVDGFKKKDIPEQPESTTDNNDIQEQTEQVVVNDDDVFDFDFNYDIFDDDVDLLADDQQFFVEEGVPDDELIDNMLLEDTFRDVLFEDDEEFALADRRNDDWKIEWNKDADSRKLHYIGTSVSTVRRNRLIREETLKTHKALEAYGFQLGKVSCVRESMLGGVVLGEGLWREVRELDYIVIHLSFQNKVLYFLNKPCLYFYLHICRHIKKHKTTWN